MGIYSNCGVPERDVKNNVCCLVPDTRKGAERIKVLGNFTVEALDQLAAEANHVFRFVPVETDPVDIRDESLFTERENRLGGVRVSVKNLGGLIYALIGGLRGKHHGNEELKRRPIVQFAFGIRTKFGEAPENFPDIG